MPYSARALARYATLGVLVVAFPARTARGQAVRIETGPIRPFPSEASQHRGAKDAATPASSVALYATAFLGPAGTVDGVSPDARASVHYATVHLLFSAVALPHPRATEFRIVGNLRRLNAQVTLTPLDSAQRPIESLAALQLLAALPDSMVAASPRASGDSGSTSAATAAFSVVTKTLMLELQGAAVVGNRIGAALASFAGLYHRPTARLQVGYISDARSFGWMWYADEQDIIEGTHRASAAVEVTAAVRYVRVQLHLVGEWQSHGSWQRDHEVVLSLSALP